MDQETLSSLVHGLNDIELAVLLCLVADKHCILTTEDAGLEELEQEVDVVCLPLPSSRPSNGTQIGTQVFGLLTVTVQCTPETTLDDFVGGILVNEETRRVPSSPLISPLLSPDVCVLLRYE
jgi:hypothetical protein